MVGVNDPSDTGEVRISFGAFLAAGSGELGSLSRTSPDRPRVGQCIDGLLFYKPVMHGPLSQRSKQYCCHTETKVDLCSF